ncbi:hypothetical protein VMT65_08650 [Nocardia sp. CDC153]|uniref:hypothetical protein n=1 Tax=Nocardia sp. CDC153 TaxID=3112167 RepID=UPI002DB69628|nr:hypothetical protein [Nocardia sp. CDC153]MEC3953096.1 hypothetical protein [Nocardia sp. CDC153]
MANPNNLTEREFMALIAKRPGMYIGRPNFPAITHFLTGYDTAARRYGQSLLDGFGDWLITNYTGQQTSLGWPGSIMSIALPDHGFLDDLTPEEHSHVLDVLFDLLDKFLAERE